MKKTLIFITTFLILLIGCKKNNDNNPLIVAMELQYPPFEMSDSEGNPSGISVDIAYKLGKYLNRSVKIENTAWTGLIPSLQSGKADIIISSMTITEERKKVVDFSTPYIKSGLSLLISSSSDVKSYEDLNNDDVVVAVKSGTIGANLAQKELTNAEIHLFDEVAACVLEVSQGKADAFIYDALTVYKNHVNNPQTTKMNLESIEGTEGYWGMAVKKGNEDFLNKVNEFIIKSREDTTFDTIADKYLEEIKEVFKKENIPFFFDI